MFLYNDNSPVNFADPLPEAVDVVIIGGGVIGISTAWTLREQGHSVLVCDKGRVAGEQSSRNWGWVRVMQRDPAEVPIAIDSLNRWEKLNAELGEGIGFERRGILGLAHNEREWALCEEWMVIAAEHGVDTQMLSPKDIEGVIDVAPGFWKGGIITPSDGRAEPFTAVKTIAEGLRARGGLVREACAVRTVEREAGRVSAVVTEHGTVRTQAVVCAAGAWSALFLSNLGIALPQLSLRGTVARTQQAPEVFGGAAGLHDVFIRRRRDGGYSVACEIFQHAIGAASVRHMFRYLPSLLRFGGVSLRVGGDVTQRHALTRSWSGDEITPFEKNRVLNPRPSARAVKAMRSNLNARVPALKSVPFAETWAGMIDAMPDIVPVMDAVAGCEGLYLATGFSGHGFGFGPGAGAVMADLVTGATPRFDLSRFRLSRFSDGSKMVLGPSI